VIALYLLSFVVPELKPHRRLLLFLSLALTLAPLAVVLLKAASMRHCPWNLQEFGGFAQHPAPLAVRRRAGLWGGLAAGLALGMVRVAQGAHFFSHNLWSALVCWLVILALYLAILGTPSSTQVEAAAKNTK
jgi:membrane-associated PAP2 superfamily phosphatase